MSRTLHSAIAAVGIALLATAGCTPQPQPPVTPVPSVASSETVTVPSTVQPSASPTSLAPQSPDASTAGSLSAVSLPPTFLGFTPDIREPEEGEFVPNGTWVYAANDPASAATQTWPQCGTQQPGAPQYVLMGMYANDEGALGVGQAFEFASAADAGAWFNGYAADLQACQDLGDQAYTQVVDHTTSGTVIADRRLVAGAPWGERVALEGAVITFVVVQADATLDQLLAAP